MTPTNTVNFSCEPATTCTANTLQEKYEKRRYVPFVSTVCNTTEKKTQEICETTVVICTAQASHTMPEFKRCMTEVSRKGRLVATGSCCVRCAT